MERLAFTTLFDTHLSDPRDSDPVTPPFAELHRTVLVMLAHGWSDHLEVTALRDDPVFRLVWRFAEGARSAPWVRPSEVVRALRTCGIDIRVSRGVHRFPLLRAALRAGTRRRIEAVCQPNRENCEYARSLL